MSVCMFNQVNLFLGLPKCAKINDKLGDVFGGHARHFLGGRLRRGLKIPTPGYDGIPHPYKTPLVYEDPQVVKYDRV